MIVVLMLAIAFGLGVDLRRLLVLAAAIYLPIAVSALIAVHWFRARPDAESSASLFCEGVASELRSGANLRDALTTAATSVGSEPTPVDLTSAASIAEVAARVSGRFPEIADELELTIIAASRSGSDAASLFDEIGSLAIAQAEVRREIRVATAPGRATALVLVGAPVVYVLSRFSSGGLSRLLASSDQRVVAFIGLGLFLLGLATAALVLWSASR